VIATGASITEADHQTLLHQGFHNTIGKPFNIQQLAALIEESLAVMV
jgi:DNA-binding response OmpR family regulator